MKRVGVEIKREKWYKCKEVESLRGKEGRDADSEREREIDGDRQR
jgi:hypothetical protein